MTKQQLLEAITSEYRGCAEAIAAKQAELAELELQLELAERKESKPKESRSVVLTKDYLDNGLYRVRLRGEDGITIFYSNEHIGGNFLMRVVGGEIMVYIERELSDRWYLTGNGVDARWVRKADQKAVQHIEGVIERYHWNRFT